MNLFRFFAYDIWILHFTPWSYCVWIPVIFRASGRDGACEKLSSFFYIGDVASPVKRNAIAGLLESLEDLKKHLSDLAISLILITGISGKSLNFQ